MDHEHLVLTSFAREINIMSTLRQPLEQENSIITNIWRQFRYGIESATRLHTSTFYLRCDTFYRPDIRVRQ